MGECIRLEYDVDGQNFASAGHASESVKRMLKQMGVPALTVRRVAIAMYEGEINMVIHADGGEVEVTVGMDTITIRLTDHGPGIPDVDRAMEEGFSTAGDVARDLGFGAGMGLPNMKRCSDDMTIDTQVGVGTTVTMQIHIN